MSLDLARERVYLEKTKLRYVNLPNILNDAMWDRRARVDGLVGVVLGQIHYWIFMRDGEGVSAARREVGKRAALVPIGEVVRVVERGDDHGHIFYYGMPESQLRAMYASTGALLDAGAALNTADPVDFFFQVRQLQLDGVLELEAPAALHYLVLRGGEVAEAYLAGLPPGLSRGDFLKSLLNAEGWRRCGVRAYAPVSELPAQAGPALVRLYGGLLEQTLALLGAEIGVERAREAVVTALAEAAAQHACLGGLGFEGDRIVGEPVATAPVLTAGVADWFLRALRRAERHGLLSPAEVADAATAPARLALNQQGFLSRLPWPLSV
ncbi:MAG: hypothetical protein HY704_16180 [Gemmatimonadetes bacterium]|nr:hypothetical protein [Gemmatimonadota bacterium]